jgi:hypothetical protein
MVCDCTSGVYTPVKGLGENLRILSPAPHAIRPVVVLSAARLAVRVVRIMEPPSFQFEMPTSGENLLHRLLTFLTNRLVIVIDGTQVVN